MGRLNTDFCSAKIQSVRHSRNGQQWVHSLELWFFLKKKCVACVGRGVHTYLVATDVDCGRLRTVHPNPFALFHCNGAEAGHMAA